MTASDRRQRFRLLHRDGFFVLPNPWDVGSAKLLTNAGFAALATTSAGFAASIGRLDQHVSRDELVSHVRNLCAATGLPVNVDAEHGYASDVAGLAETIDLLADAGAAGLSIEDYDPDTNALMSIEAATERIGAAAEATKRHGIVLTARAENYLYGVTDLDDTIVRLRAFQGAGADVAYAPGLATIGDIARVVREVSIPINVLAWPGGPSPAEIASAGARRMSLGGSLAWVAYGALETAATELLGGSLDCLGRRLPGKTRDAAFG